MNKPKIRFEGYTEAWEQRKLVDELEYLKDGTHGTHKDSNNGPYLLSAKNIKNGKIIIDDESDRKISQEEFNQIHTKFELKNGDVLLTIVGSIGETAILENAGDFTFQRSVAFLRPGKNITSDFLKTEIDAEPFQKELNDRKSQSAQPGIYLGDLSKIPIYITNKDEQKKIGEYFRNLDNLITLHQRKCEQTKKLKKYMLQKMLPQNGELYPEIRFEGFTEAWEQRKFKDVFDYLQNNSLSRADLSDENGKLLNVHYGDILIKFGEVIDLTKEKLPSIVNEDILSKYQSSTLKDGDIIIADAAEDETVGKCSEIKGSEHYTVLSGLHTIPVRPKEKYGVGYLGYFMNSSSYHNQLLPLMQGTKVSSISKSAIQDTIIMFPKAIDEQAQIGQYFERLDNLITLHQHKCEELQNIKKYMLQNMFAQ